MIDALRRAWDRWQSRSRDWREARGGLWMQTTRGWWLQALRRGAFWPPALSHVAYVGVPVKGSIETTSGPCYRLTCDGIVHRDLASDHSATYRAFDNLLAAFLRDKHKRGIPVAKVIQR